MNANELTFGVEIETVAPDTAVTEGGLRIGAYHHGIQVPYLPRGRPCGIVSAGGPYARSQPDRFISQQMATLDMSKFVAKDYQLQQNSSRSVSVASDNSYVARKRKCIGMHRNKS